MASRHTRGRPTLSRLLTRLALVSASVALVGWCALCTVLSPARVAATVEATLAELAPAERDAAPADAPTVPSTPAPAPAAAEPAPAAEPAAVDALLGQMAGGTDPRAGGPGLDALRSQLESAGITAQVQALLGDPGLRAAIADEVAGTLEPGERPWHLGPVTERAALAAGLGPEVAARLAAQVGDVQPPAPLRWAASARTVARTVVPAAALWSVVLLGAALVLAPRRSWPLRRAGWWAVRASILPLGMALARRLLAGDGDGLVGGLVHAGSAMGTALVPTALVLLAGGAALHLAARVVDRSAAARLVAGGPTAALAAAGGPLELP